MGKQRKRYNEKARTQLQVGSRYKTGDDLTNKGENQQTKNVDDTNQLVLISKEESIIKKTDLSSSTARPLSKRQRKHVEKVADRKKKAAQRSQLLDELSKFQVGKEEYQQFSSTTSLGQTHKRKAAQTDGKLETIINSVQSKRRKRKAIPKKKPTIVKSPSSSDVSSSEEEPDEESDDSNGADQTERQDETIEETKGGDIASAAVSSAANHTPKDAATCTPTVQPKEPPTEVAKSSASNDAKPAVYVQLNRTPEIQTARLLLPILAEEQIIMETINENDVVILCGETGSGKTTQIPQFLYEAGYGTHSPHSGMIGITQPRRVAAVNMSKRVATEMNFSTRKVSYLIRYEGNATDDTVVKFMTDGVLLKEMETDFLLTKYSALIIDEAHERSVFTDILIGLLSRVVPLRNKQGKHLKLIIMSATLRTDDFTSNSVLFAKPPPIVKVDARQYPVTVHFNRKTDSDYISEAYRKICKIHRTLKDGGILVFLTGQNEIHALCRKLKKTFPQKMLKSSADLGDTTKKFDLDRYDVVPNEFHDYQEDLDDEENDLFDSDGELDDSAYSAAADASLPMHVLPLYSLLSPEKQAEVFSSHSTDSRLCIVATNVAETSLTIPGIKYVVDTGKVKRKFYDKVTGVSSFRVTWTSKASANQRAGRAGRVEAGHCYRLYSSAVFVNDFEEFSPPEIMRRPVDDLVLQMKSMNIEKVINFPFPTPPDKETLMAAEALLLDLGALKVQKAQKGPKTAVITSVGQTMAKLPVSPRFSKMISLSLTSDVLQFIITIVSALTVKEMFTDDVNLPDDVAKDGCVVDTKTRTSLITQARRRWAGTGSSALLGDLMVALRAVGACKYANCSSEFCSENGLRQKAMIEIRKLRSQLTNAAASVSPNAALFVDPKMKPPTEEQSRLIRQIVLSGMGDHVARKIPQSDAKELKIKNAYTCLTTNEALFIHPSSALFVKLPEFVVYQDIMQTKKPYMKGVMAIESHWLPRFLPGKCRFGKPLDEPVPRFDCDTGKVVCHMPCTFGPHSWQVAPCEVAYPGGTDRFRWFGRFLLEGQVFQKLKSFVPSFLTPPSVMTKSWANLQPRTVALLSALVTKNVDKKSSLDKAWRSDEKYLLDAYLQWLPEHEHFRVRQQWPPFDE